MLSVTVLRYQILTKEQGSYATWDRLHWGPTVSYSLKKWTETIKINQRHCTYWNTYEKPVMNHNKTVSSSPSLAPQPSVPSSCYGVFPLLFRHFWFLQAYSPLGLRSGKDNWLALILWTIQMVTVLRQSHLWKSEAIPRGPWGQCGFPGRPDQPSSEGASLLGSHIDTDILLYSLSRSATNSN